MPFSDELRLFALLALNTIVLFCAVRFARRANGGGESRDSVQVALDAMMLWYTTQYVSVALPGMLHCFSLLSISIVAVIISAAMWRWPIIVETPGAGREQLTTLERRVLLACIGFLCAFVLGPIFVQRYTPPMISDSLTYHLTAAARWVQSGTLSLSPTWFFNPANTYSPLAGSVLFAWLIAPLGNEVVARCGEAPALLMLFLAMVQLSRGLGASAIVAALIALAACCARPFISESILPKDDLLVAAFFATALASLDVARLRERIGPLRLGLAVGLLLAMKYTVLLCAIPPLLLAIDAPICAGWRWKQYFSFKAIALAIVGPWYVRNAIVTHNPFFPVRVGVGSWTIFPGLFSTHRADELRTLHGTWRALTGTYFSAGAWVMWAMIALWAIALLRIARTKRVLVDPIARVIILGPIVSIGLFVLFSPYAEVRFVFPAFVMLFACGAIALRGRAPGVALAAIVLVVCIATSFVPDVLKVVAEPVLWFALVIAAFIILLHKTRYILGVGAAIVLVLITIFWKAYLSDYQTATLIYWSDPAQGYGQLGDAWKFVRTELPPGSIAYTNTSLVYPLFGFRLDRNVIYAPTRPGVRTIADLGEFNRVVSGAEIDRAAIELARRQPDRDTWHTNLQNSGARFLFVATDGSSPPELLFLLDNPHFKLLFHNSAASIYAIDW